MLAEQRNARKLLPGVGILGLNNMFHGILPMKSLPLMSYEKNLKSFASPNLMMSRPALTCLQALGKEKGL